MQAANQPAKGRDPARVVPAPAVHARYDIGNNRQLLDALPIAAAVVGRTRRGTLKLLDRNTKFDEVMADRKSVV